MTEENPEAKVARYFDRDLSWLAFNYRVLTEAKDPNLPVYDRLKFLAIHSSNLDEFFRVRVATIRNLARIKKKKVKAHFDIPPKEVLEMVLAETLRQQDEYAEIFHQQIMGELRDNGIFLYQNEDIFGEHKPVIRHIFRSKVLSYLQPVFIREGISSFLENKMLYFIVILKRGEEERYALVNIPSDHMGRFISLPKIDDTHYYIMLDDVIRCNMDRVFPGYEVKGAYSIKMNRDADLNLEDEFTGDLVEKLKKQLAKRGKGSACRFLYDYSMPEDHVPVVKGIFSLLNKEMMQGGKYHNFNDFFKFPNPRKPDLQSSSISSIPSRALNETDSVFEAIRQGDKILHFPYQSYDYVLSFFNEAAIDPHVTDIWVTLYRIASDSLIANALISAARNGKNVMVFVELKARFDEENNLRWAQKMEDAGIRIIYSIPGLKVHAKVAYVRREENEKVDRFAYFGTGNFNESTANIYADHGLLTSNPTMIDDLEKVFSHLHEQKDIEVLKSLLVSQFNLKGRFIELIDREIKNAKEGRKSHIIIKLNNLEERDMIEKLYEASEAGVKVDLINRGICCLIPGKKGLSENIRMLRLVDMYLEHARVFVFHNDGSPEMYMGSSDWMNRNLHSRIEVVFPILVKNTFDQIMEIIQLQLIDNTKAAWVDENHENHRITNDDPPLRAQMATYEYLKRLSE